MEGAGKGQGRRWVEEGQLGLFYMQESYVRMFPVRLVRGGLVVADRNTSRPAGL